jgi:SAM-dependent methyltransferase
MPGDRVLDLSRFETNHLRSLRIRIRRASAALLTWRSVLSNPYIAGKLQPLMAEDDYAVLTRPAPPQLDGELPTPPRELWERWADTLENYLEAGRVDMERMLRILAGAGVSDESQARVLDFGCAEGRMLRFFPRRPESELWGVDINAQRVAWAQQHLPPPFRVLTTTTAPHLPFPDAYFDLIYCHSVFTHISDLADAWFLELLRILRPGGHIYLTIHDEHTVELLLGRYRDANAHVAEAVQHLGEQTDVLSKEWIYFAILADPGANVFYNSQSLVDKWSRFADCVEIRPEAAEYQTAVVFRKPMQH